MTYFAIGEDNGGAGEKRLGPFPTPEEAAQAGRKETRESNGGFVFRGVVDEANNQVGFDIEPIVSTNSVVMNAMAANRRTAMNWGPWKPGQRVKEENGTRTGTVVKQGGLNDLLVTVKWDDGKTEDMHRFQLKAANRRMARNAIESKQFGNVIAKANEFEGFGISLASISHRAEGNTAKECVSEAKKMLAEYEKAVSGMKQAISWMEQSAK